MWEIAANKSCVRSIVRPYGSRTSRRTQFRLPCCQLRMNKYKPNASLSNLINHIFILMFVHKHNLDKIISKICVLTLQIFFFFFENEFCFNPILKKLATKRCFHKRLGRKFVMICCGICAAIISRTSPIVESYNQGKLFFVSTWRDVRV